ncbi:MAG: VCBS repeat-containing protein [Acidobacteriota bacterium]|nr:VCBS repeat-containing protein [Acidobacteriota bacterium]
MTRGCRRGAPSGRPLWSVGLLLSLHVSAGSAVASQDATGEGPAFVTHTISAELMNGYQPVIVDMNRDGRPDVIGLSTRLDELAWFENPGWERHVIATGLNRAINLAAEDLDDDGIPELVVAHEFGTTHENSLGILTLLTHRGDPTHVWEAREIDRTPTVHRVRWADMDGTGQRVLVTAPLTGPAATAPEYRDSVSLYWYQPDDWSRHLISGFDEGVVHGLLVKPWMDPDRDAVFTASFVGVHVHQFIDGEWIRGRLTGGDSSAWPQSGSSEVEIGRLGAGRFIATIEPWHGDSVVVYRQESESWTRQVIDTIDSGHTIVTGDFDGDGRDEIVTGDRRDSRSLYLYRATDPVGGDWSRHVLDDGDMSPSGCAVADLNGDTRIDLVCIGGSTANLKWYENTRNN